MKKVTLILVVFIHHFSFAQNKDGMPGIREVVEKFYMSYSILHLEVSYVLFEKRETGWYVVTKKISGQQPTDDKRILFFDKAGQKYKDLGLPVVTTDDSKEFSFYVSDWDAEWFDLYPYYGYSGWYKDVIHKYENTQLASDSDLYILGRAYSVYAGSLLSDQLGFSLPAESFHLPLKLNVITPRQIHQYEQISQKGIDLFQQLQKQNPAFETRVGNISIKYAHKVMAMFHNLVVFAPEYAKTIKLPDDLYPDSTITMARAILGFCSKNAIYLSFGDNDFYPELYLQQHDHFRRDVYMFNYSLLGLDHYIYRFSNPQFDATGIKFQADTSLYKNDNNNYILLTDSAKSFTIPQLITKLKNYRGDRPMKLGGNIFSLRLRKPGVKENLFEYKKLKFEQKYILVNQWILLDMIEHLNGRELNMSNLFYDDLKPLNLFLKQNNLIYRLGSN